MPVSKYIQASWWARSWPGVHYFGVSQVFQGPPKLSREVFSGLALLLENWVRCFNFWDVWVALRIYVFLNTLVLYLTGQFLKQKCEGYLSLVCLYYFWLNVLGIGPRRFGSSYLQKTPT